VTDYTFLQYAWIIPFLPLSSFFVNIFFGKRLPRQGDWVSLATISTALFISAGIFYEVIVKTADPAFHYHKVFPWLQVTDRFALNAGILVDNVTAVMLVVVTLVSSLVHLFSIGYMHGDPRYNRFFAFLSIFSFSMLGLVLSESLFFIYVFWELVGLSSYLLIGFWFEKKSASDANKKAFITNRVGDFGFLAGIMILFAATGVVSYDEVFAGVQAGKISGNLLTLAGVCVFCGAVGKSAQFPLHIWLPDAMEGPTPVSALIHAATMVAAGVYLVGRVYPIFTPDAFLVIAYIGLITLFIAASIAIAQDDIKKVLAYSTISQLGFMIMGLGVGGYTAGLAHLLTHAGFKACLFLGSGSVIHAVHSQDVKEMGGLYKKMPITFATFLIATMAIAGVPFFSGFYSKDMILGEALVFGMKHPQHIALFIVTLLTAGITAFYMFRIVIYTFFGHARDHHKYDHAHESPFTMAFPLIVLAGLSFSFWYSPWVGKLIVKPDVTKQLANCAAYQATLGVPHPDAFGNKPVLASAAAPAAAEAAALPAHGGEAAPAAAAHGAAPAPAGHEATAAPAAAHGEAPAAHGAPPAAEAGHGAPAEGGHGAAAEGAHGGGGHDAHLVHKAHQTAMYLSILIASLGIGLSFVTFYFGWIDAGKVAGALPGLHKFLKNKWYFDELYQATIIAWALGFARLCAKFDQKVVDGIVNFCGRAGVFVGWFIGRFDALVVDGAVNGVASVTTGSGTLLRKIQTGKLYHYVFVLLVGAVVIFLVKAF
jgi:NADH-quinone oxidoreductase subunit L